MSNDRHDLVYTVDVESLSRMLLFSLIGFELFLVLLDAVVNYGDLIEYSSIQRLCNVAREDGLAAWLMTSQTLVAALLLWFHWWLSRRAVDVKPFYQRGWLTLALFFTYMAADDGALIHERLGSMFEKMLSHSDGSESSLASWLQWFPSYEWQLLLPFFVLMGLFVLYFLWRVFGLSSSLVMVVSALACFTFAVALDFVEGMQSEHPMNVYTWLKHHYQLDGYTVDHFAKVLEEFLEMVGMSLFVAVFVAQLGRVQRQAPFSVRFTAI